ncbi:MAG: IPT/TIG domain-containing protein [Candidatus Acidiferrales bacterium]
MRRAQLLLLIFLLGIQLGCGSTGSSTKTPPPATVSVSVSPTTANVRVSGTQTFAATVTGSTNQSVTWSVNGVAGGNSSVGTISAAGKYTSPATVPSSNAITVEAVAQADASATGSSAVTILNPVPSIANVAPSAFSTGTFTITVNGSNFVNGAQVLWAGAPVTTTFVSSSQLKATETEPTAGTYAVSVSNPNPGESTTGTIHVTVTSSSSGGGGAGSGGGGGTQSACSAISTGQGASLNGFLPFPADNLWNKNIASEPVDPNSAAIINFIGGSDPVHPDFGSGTYDGSSIGIPYMVVNSSQAPVAINFTAYGDESDPGPMPIPATAPIEGYPNPGNGDRHVLVLDNGNCFLYEMDNSWVQTNGSWNADSAAVWDLLNDEQRPLTWTSADAAGLSIFAGLVRYDEVASGSIQHAIRITLQNSRAAFIPPASHWAANSSNANAAPMGMRLRLKASFDISGFSATNQVILKALQQYGAIMADNGSNLYISGTPDNRWDNDDLHNLDEVTAGDFEVVQMGTVYTSSNLPTGAAPTISSFTASETSVAAGTEVTLNWSVAGASYLIVTPEIGATRGTSVTVVPTATTTYTLVATNEFGRTTQPVTVTVP